MKSLFITVACFFSLLTTSAQDKTNRAANDKEAQIVEASCGQCKFGLKAKGCNLAVRINDKAYFVDGSDIDSHGDAHADDGFCNAIRKAKVKGDVVDGRFKATYFELLPEPAKKEKSK